MSPLRFSEVYFTEEITNFHSYLEQEEKVSIEAGGEKIKFPFLISDLK